MKVGVISDTHIRLLGKSLPSIIFKIFEDVDAILHAGDMLSEEVVFELEAIAPVYAVAGNNDSYETFYKYGKRKLIEFYGKRIGLIHGEGKSSTINNAYTEFKNDDVDCIVYGHSHISHNEIIKDILFFNPGSPTQRRSQPKHSVGLLYIDDNSIKGEIIFI